MKKYQLSITLVKNADKNSAASKAVIDCNRILTDCGYEDYSLTFSEGMNSVIYYAKIFLKLFIFLLKLKRGDLVAVQYPMLNNVFKYFIKAASLKNVRFYCITHDIESLRLGGTDKNLVNKELSNLNYYNYLIVHNQVMINWLKNNGVVSPMYAIELFDYLSAAPLKIKEVVEKNIVYAGNLAKSRFIYDLDKIPSWQFNVYGPNYNQRETKTLNMNWLGQYSPEQIATELDGDFGLIWDGTSISESDAAWGNYLRYNNPHKFSLYIAAGLPVIAPRDSAIAKIISEESIGLLIDNLYDLNNLDVSFTNYESMKTNCLKIRDRLINGHYFIKAINEAEVYLAK